MIVIACNSATAAALTDLRKELAGLVPVVGVVKPESRVAAQVTNNDRVGLLATPATIASGAYERALAEAGPDTILTAVPCPDLAPIIQAGREVDEALVDIVEGYCEPLRDAGVDTVILGCTHYPLVRPVLQRALGRGVRLVTSGQAIADSVEAELRRVGLDNDADRRGNYRFLCSGDPELFRRLGTRFLQLPLGEVRQVAVETPSAATVAV
jgi:glutamate racemase